MPPVSKKNVKKNPLADRKVLHPEIEVKLAIGDNAITAEKAKEILGWEECDKDEEGVNNETSTLVGKKVRMVNNLRNRFLTPSWLLTLRQEHLNKRFIFNAETIVIGKTGVILSGQNRLISLILAELERTEGDQKLHWSENWPGPVTMETLVVYGVDESDAVFKTFNSGKKATFAEFLFRHEFLSKYKAGDRKDIARMTDFAVKLLWQRTGESKDAFSPRRTNAEAEDFVIRHPKLLKAVKHVYDENQRTKDDDGKMGVAPIGQYLSPGYAAAMCYLMATSATDIDVYNNKDRHEKACDFQHAEKANQFWIDLAAGARGPLKEVAHAIAALSDPDTGAIGNLNEKLAVITLAWAKYSLGKKLAAPADGELVSPDLDLTDYYEEDEDGVRSFKSGPSMGGIDRDAPPPGQDAYDDDSDEGESEEGGEEETPTKPTAEQKAAKREADKAKIMAMKNAKAPAKDAVTMTPTQQLQSVKEDLGIVGHVVITKIRSGALSAVGPDAELIKKVSKLSGTKDADGTHRVTLQPADLDKVAEMVAAAGKTCTLVEESAAGKDGGTKREAFCLVEAKVKGKK